MARKPRVGPAGVAQHVVQRGNNRQICFGCEQDFAAFAHWLREAVERFEVDLHAWVFMTNHVHLLATPRADNAISGMMQHLGRRYVPYFNHRWGRTGTLWEGRFKSCLVQDGHYLLQCYRYIELNPVRAGMVSDPAQYRWSSYRTNGLGVGSSLCIPHPEYLALGDDLESRLTNYRTFCSDRVDNEVVTGIRQVTDRGLVLGDVPFVREMENLTGRRLRPGSKGRPSKRQERDAAEEIGSDPTFQ